MINGSNLDAIRGAESRLEQRGSNIARWGASGADSVSIEVNGSNPRLRMRSNQAGGMSQDLRQPATALVPLAEASPKAAAVPLTTSSLRSNSKSSDPTEDLIGIKEDARTASYNLKAVKAQDRLAGTLLDMLA